MYPSPLVFLTPNNVKYDKRFKNQNAIKDK